MARVIILNAPPSCGKDCIAEHLNGIHSSSAITPFKEALYQLTAEHYKLDFDTVVELCTNRETKEEGHPYFTGSTPRQALIHVSEVVTKPKLGKGFFGKVLSQTVDSLGVQYAFVPDGGFPEELEEVAKNHDVLVIRLHRDELNFEGDSRNYLYPTYTYSADVHLTTGDIQGGVKEVLRKIEEWECLID